MGACRWEPEYPSFNGSCTKLRTNVVAAHMIPQCCASCALRGMSGGDHLQAAAAAEAVLWRLTGLVIEAAPDLQRLLDAVREILPSHGSQLC